MEHILNEWLPIWKTCRKTNYVNLTMTNMEILYSEISSIDLEYMRLNRIMRQKENGGMIAIDECCEVLNDHLKKMTSFVKIDSLVNKSLFISLMKRCTKILGPDNLGKSEKANKKGINITPTRKLELDTIKKLFYYVVPFTPLGRKLTDNWMWDSYNHSKVKVKNIKNIILPPHEIKVAELFNILSTSNSTAQSDKLPEIENYGNEQSHRDAAASAIF